MRVPVIPSSLNSGAWENGGLIYRTGSSSPKGRARGSPFSLPLQQMCLLLLSGPLVKYKWDASYLAPLRTEPYGPNSGIRPSPSRLGVSDCKARIRPGGEGICGFGSQSLANRAVRSLVVQSFDFAAAACASP